MTCRRVLNGASTLVLCSVLYAQPSTASAQVANQALPAVTIDAPRQKPAASTRRVAASRPARSARTARVPTAPPQTASDQPRPSGSLAVLTAQQALAEINQTPGGVALV